MNKGLKIGLLVFEIGDKADELLKVIRQISADIHIHLFDDKSSDYQIDILVREYIDKLIKNIDDEKPGEVAFAIIKSLVINKGEYTITDQVQEKAVDLSSIVVVIRKDDNGNKTAEVVDVSNNDDLIATVFIGDKINFNTDAIVHNSAFSNIYAIVELVVNYVIGFADKEDNYPYQFALTYEIINMALEHLHDNK